MPNPNSRNELKEYCLRKLGQPVIEINVADEQVEDRIDDALKMYHDFHYDGIERTIIRYELSSDDKDSSGEWKGYIPLSDNVLSIENVLDLSTDGSETTAQFLLNLGEQAIDVASGDVYIIIDDGGGFLSLSNDTEPSSPNNFDRNWINVGSGWGLISSGYPDFAGDFGILAGFIGVPGANDQQSFALSSVYGNNNKMNFL